MSRALQYQTMIGCNADHTQPNRLFPSPTAPMFYPASYFVRRMTMLRLGADGVPEVVAP